MKPLYYYLKLLKKSKSNQNFRKRAILFVSLGAFTFLTVSGLALWGALSAISYVSDATSQVLSTPAAKEQAKTLREGLKELPNLQALACLNRAQQLLAITPWLERPVLANLVLLKNECLIAPSAAEMESESEGASQMPFG
ncbi:MAG: hypothetical protein WCI18_13830 [Pseudomonadota bacterium]